MFAEEKYYPLFTSFKTFLLKTLHGLTIVLRVKPTLLPVAHELCSLSAAMTPAALTPAH